MRTLGQPEVESLRKGKTGMIYPYAFWWQGGRGHMEFEGVVVDTGHRNFEGFLNHLEAFDESTDELAIIPR
jgi:hypothetical protein